MSTDYFLKAVEAVRENRQRYAKAEAQAMLNRRTSLPGLNQFFLRSFSAESGDDEG